MEEEGDSYLTINKISCELNVDRRTITKHLKDKEPDKIKGKLKLYKLSRVAEILEEASGSGSERHGLEIKKIIAQIKNIEIRNEELLKKLIPADQVSKVWLSHIQKAKSTLMAIEDLAPCIVGLKVNQIKSKLHESIMDVIKDLNESPIENETATEDNQ